MSKKLVGLKEGPFSLAASVEIESRITQLWFGTRTRFESLAFSTMQDGDTFRCFIFKECSNELGMGTESTRVTYMNEPEG